MVMQASVLVKGLSAAELLLLLDLGTPPREVLKAGLKELRALRMIAVERHQPQTRWKWTAQKYLSFSSGEPPQNAVLRRLLEQLRTASRHSQSLPVVLKRLQDELGVNFEDFKQRTILPSLVRQGLLEPHSRKILGLFTANAHRYTPEGVKLKVQLEQGMSQARQIVRLIKDDPAQVVALMASLGAALILMPKFWPHLTQINRLWREDGGDGVILWASGEGDHRHDDLSDLNQDFASLDSGVDSTGGDGGGE